jgi:hypothetical protein
MFTLRHKETGKYVMFAARANEDGYACVDISYYIGLNLSEGFWVAPTHEMAEYARANNTGWYNAEYSTPSHDHSFNPDDWQVIELI